MDHETFRKNMAEAEAWPPMPENEKRLRILLANVYGCTYRDDGELQNSADHPLIDFKRDPVEQIGRAISTRNILKMADSARVVQRHGWIPVSNPPAANTECITYSSEWGVAAQTFDGKDFLDYGEPDRTITHWMPLPAKPGAPSEVERPYNPDDHAELLRRIGNWHGWEEHGEEGNNWKRAIARALGNASGCGLEKHQGSWRCVRCHFVAGPTRPPCARDAEPGVGVRDWNAALSAAIDTLPQGHCDPLAAAIRALKTDTEPGQRQHVAWLRYNDHNGRRATTVHLCDSDAPGAFRVYRHD